MCGGRHRLQRASPGIRAVSQLDPVNVAKPAGQPAGRLIGFDNLVKALGAPRSKTPPGEEAAYGAIVRSWSWPGVDATMVSNQKTGQWRARSIIVRAPIKLATKAGVRIGSTRKQVEARYKP